MRWNVEPYGAIQYGEYLAMDLFFVSHMYAYVHKCIYIYIYANSIHIHRDTGYFFFGAHSARLAACLFHSAFSPANSEVQKTSATNAPHTFHLLAAGAHLQLHIARPLEARLTAGRHGGLQF